MTEGQIEAYFHQILNCNSLDEIERVIPSHNSYGFEKLMNGIIEKLKELPSDDRLDKIIELCKKHLKGEKKEAKPNKIIFATSKDGNCYVLSDLKDIPRELRDKFGNLLDDFIQDDYIFNDDMNGKSMTLRNGQKEKVMKVKNMAIDKKARYYGFKLPHGYVMLVGALYKNKDEMIDPFLKSRISASNGIPNEFEKYEKIITNAYRTGNMNELNDICAKGQIVLNQIQDFLSKNKVIEKEREYMIDDLNAVSKDFKRYYIILKKFYDENGTINVTDLSVKGAPEVRKYVRYFCREKDALRLGLAEIRLLNKLGINWEYGKDNQRVEFKKYDELLERVKEFGDLYGAFDIPRNEKMADGYPIGKNVDEFRKLCQKSEIPATVVNKFKQIGFDFEVRSLSDDMKEQMELRRIKEPKNEESNLEETQTPNIEILSTLDQSLSFKLTQLKDENRRKQELIETIMKKQKEIEAERRKSEELDSKIADLMKEARQDGLGR